MSEPWVCLIGSDRYFIDDVLWIYGDILYSGCKVNAHGENEGFIGCVSKNRLKYFKLIKGIREVYKLNYHSDDRILVCGKCFLGCFDYSLGKFKWIKGSEVGLYSLCSHEDTSFIGGGLGRIALLNKDRAICEKKLTIKNSVNEWWVPSIRGACCLRDKYVIAGDLPKLISKDSERDFWICFLDKDLVPEQCISFGGLKLDWVFLNSICCDHNYVYFCGCTVSTGFGKEDIVICCLNRRGEIEWCRVYGVKLSDISNCIKVYDKYLYIAGYSGNNGCLLVIDKRDGDIVEGKLIGAKNRRTSLLGMKLTRDHFLVCGWTTIHYGKQTGLLMLLPKNLGKIEVGKEEITISKWNPRSKEWWPRVRYLESTIEKAEVFTYKKFSVVEKTPEILFSSSFSLVRHVASPTAILRTISVSAARKVTSLDYFNLLLEKLHLIKELSFSRDKVYFFKCDLSVFSGVWCCVRLGCGGWGCSYLGEQNEHRVVFKVPRGYESIIEEGKYPTINLRLMKRIVDEAKVIKKLDHSNILRLLAYSNKYPLLIYEYADYSNLEYQLREGWVPLFREVILLGIQIGDALRYIHSRGLVHCDIKPSNIFFVNRVAKIGDFSALVKLLSRTSNYSKFTYTPGFAAPEQRYSDLRRKVIELGYENRIDVYQLGNLLLYLLTGESIDGEDIYDRKLVEGIVSQVEYGDLKKLIKSTLSDKAWERPSADEVVKYLVKIYRSL